MTGNLSQTGEDIQWAASHLTEQIKKGAIELEVLRDAGLLDQDLAEHLLWYKEDWDELRTEEDEYYFEDTEFYQRKAAKNAQKNIRRAVRTGNLGVIQSVLGVLEQTEKSPDWVEYERLRSYLSQAGRILVHGAPPGHGKTNLAIKFSELYWNIYPNSVLLHNIRSLKTPEGCESYYVPGIEKLEEKVEEIDEDRDIQLLLDELSSSATGYSHDASNVVQQMATMITQMRHEGIKFIQTIGHRVVADIHPAIRGLADASWKHSKKHAKIYDQIKSQGNFGDKKHEFRGIQPCSWQYDDEESVVPFQWRDEAEESDEWERQRDEAIRTLYHNEDREVTQSDLAEAFSISQGKVSGIVNG